MTPFADLAEQITATVDDPPNGDNDNIAEPWEVAKKLQSFIFDGAGHSASKVSGPTART